MPYVPSSFFGFFLCVCFYDASICESVHDYHNKIERTFSFSVKEFSQLCTKREKEEEAMCEATQEAALDHHV